MILRQSAENTFISNDASFACLLVHPWATPVNEQAAASACCEYCSFPLILLARHICCTMSAAGICFNCLVWDDPLMDHTAGSAGSRQACLELQTQTSPRLHHIILKTASMHTCAAQSHVRSCSCRKRPARSPSRLHLSPSMTTGPRLWPAPA